MDVGTCDENRLLVSTPNAAGYANRMTLERPGRRVYHPRWAGHPRSFRFVLRTVRSSLRHQLAAILDSATIRISRLIHFAEVGVWKAVWLLREGLETVDHESWERRLNVAIVVTSVVLVWLVLRSVQVASMELVEFVTEAVETALSKLEFEAP